MNKRILMTMGVLAVAGTVAAQQWAPKAGRVGRERGPDPERLPQQLGLTDAQADQLKKAWGEQARQEIRRRADMQIARMDLHALLAAPTVDEKAVTAKVSQIGELQLAELRGEVDRQLTLRKILTPEQLKKLQQLRPRGGAGSAQRGHPGARRGRFGAPGAAGVPQAPAPPDEE